MTITARSILLLLLAFPLLCNAVRAEAAASPSGDYEKAIDDLRRDISLYPYDMKLRQSLASVYLQMGLRDLKKTRYVEAADSFAQASELCSDNMQYVLMRGIALYRDRQYDAARAQFEEAGDGFEALVFLGRISYDTGDLTGALSFWRRAQEKHPKNRGVSALIAKAERELPVESKMDKGYSAMFDLAYDAELPPGLPAQVLEALESAYNAVGADLGLFPTTRIPVLLYAKREYGSVTATPDWSGGVYDGKIRIPVGGVTEVSPQMRGIIFHEYTHVLITQLTGGNVPTWLNEGLAEVEGRRECGHRERGFPEALKKQNLLPVTTLSGAFTSMGRNEAVVAYEQSHSIADFMVSRYGWFAVQQILKGLGERATIEAATARALANWSLDLPGVMREWRESIK